MRVLFLPMAGGRGFGPLTHCLALADEAKRRGHVVAFLSPPKFLSWIDKEGFQTFNAPLPLPYQGQIPDSFKLADVALSLGLADVDFIEASIMAELHAIRHFQPDILISTYKFTAPISAQLTGKPLISTVLWPDHPDFTSPLYRISTSSDYVAAIYNKVLAKYSQPLIIDIGELSFLRSDIKLAPTSPNLEPALAHVYNLHYVGYLLGKKLEEEDIPSWLLQWDNSIPLIYVYFGAGDIEPETYTQILPKAFDGSSFKVVVSVNNHPNLSQLPQSTQNIKYVNNVPGQAIIKRSKLVIHHGGPNTAVNAVLAGTPSIMIPGMDAERDYYSRNFARLGCGIMLSRSSFLEPADLFNAVLTALNSVSSAAIHNLASQLLQLGGPNHAWDVIETELR